MLAVVQRPSSEQIEHAKRWYHETIQANVEADPTNIGKMLALDVESRTYEIADSILDAVQRLKDRMPEARPFAIRIGSPTSARIGAGRSR